MNLTKEEISKIKDFFPKGITAIDLETSGLSPLVDEIIEIAAIKIKDGEMSTFESLIRPEREIPQVTIDIHGITNDMVKDAPTVSEVLPKFINFVDGTALVAHNAKFDIGFIVYNMHQLEHPFFDSKVYCSCKLARKYVTGSENHKLSTLSEFFNIPLENHHRALDDTFACLKVFVETLKKISSNRNLNISLISNIKDYERQVEAEIPEKIKGIEKFLEKQVPIEIRYKGGSMKGEFRPIRPISLLPMPHGNILYAHCLISDIYKSFSLKKIIEFREIKKD